MRKVYFQFEEAVEGFGSSQNENAIFNGGLAAMGSQRTQCQHRIALHFTFAGRNRQELSWVICLTVLRPISQSCPSCGRYSQACARLDRRNIAHLLPQCYKKYEFVMLCFLSKNITSSLRRTSIFIL